MTSVHLCIWLFNWTVFYSHLPRVLLHVLHQQLHPSDTMIEIPISSYITLYSTALPTDRALWSGENDGVPCTAANCPFASCGYSVWCHAMLLFVAVKILICAYIFMVHCWVGQFFSTHIMGFTFRKYFQHFIYFIEQKQKDVAICKLWNSV